MDGEGARGGQACAAWLYRVECTDGLQVYVTVKHMGYMGRRAIRCVIVIYLSGVSPGGFECSACVYAQVSRHSDDGGVGCSAHWAFSHHAGGDFGRHAEGAGGGGHGVGCAVVEAAEALGLLCRVGGDWLQMLAGAIGRLVRGT